MLQKCYFKEMAMRVHVTIPTALKLLIKPKTSPRIFLTNLQLLTQIIKSS